MLRNIFAKAKAIAPCIIFFDELESFLPRRDKANYNYEKTLVTTFLSQMDGFSELKDVLVIASTNYPDTIDPAAIRPGRFDKCIYIPEPDLKAKCAILEKYLGDRTTFSKEDLTYVAQKMERFTAADIEGLVKEAYRQNKFMPLNKEDLVMMITNYKPTITLDMRDHYEKIALKYTRSFFKSEAPKTKKKHYSWEDIAGMGDVKDKIRKLVEKPLIYVEKYKEIGLDITRGVLMYGPPGCGKTLFAKVIASECNATFFVVNGPELLSKEVGESERKLREVFKSACEAKPAIIFFDEFDAIAENRALNMSSVKLINQLLTELDGMEELDGVIVIAATNRLEAIDPALRRLGRFDNTIYVGLPDNKSRQKQFEHYLNKLGSFNYEELALNSEGFSCADIEALTRKIKELELDHLIQNEDKKITQEDCLKIIRDFKNNYQKN